jgi:hypothetical protein
MGNTHFEGKGACEVALGSRARGGGGEGGDRRMQQHGAVRWQPTAGVRRRLN